MFTFFTLMSASAHRQYVNEDSLWWENVGKSIKNILNNIVIVINSLFIFLGYHNIIIINHYFYSGKIKIIHLGSFF